MNRLQVVSVVSLLMAASAVVAWAAPKDEEKAGAGQKLTLAVEGVECANCAKVISTALSGADLKVTGAIEPNAKGPSLIQAKCPEKCDLGAVAAKVNDAETPHREKVPPSLSLVLFADLQSGADTNVQAACEKISGVDAKGCQTLADKGEIRVKIAGGKPVTAQQIVDALASAGVKAQVQKTQATASAATSTKSN